MFVIISVIYRPIEQLLSRTIADRRARGTRAAPAARADRDPGRLRARVPARRAGAARTSSSNDVFDHYSALVRRAAGRHARLRGELLRARLAGRTRVLRAVRRPRADGVAVAPLLRARRRARASRAARRPSRSASPRRRSCRWSSCRRVRASGRSGASARTSAGRGAPAIALTAPITADEADAALAGPGTEGVQEAAAARRALAAPRRAASRLASRASCSPSRRC